MVWRISNRSKSGLYSRVSNTVGICEWLRNTIVKVCKSYRRDCGSCCATPSREYVRIKVRERGWLKQASDLAHHVATSIIEHHVV